MINKNNTKQGVSLEKYVDKRIDDVEDKLCLRIDALENKLEVIQSMSQIAISKAEESINDRLAVMNEFRAAMKDQQQTYVTRETFEAKQRFSSGTLRELELSKAALDAKADQKTMNRTLLFSVVSALLGIAGFIFGLVNLLIH